MPTNILILYVNYFFLSKNYLRILKYEYFFSIKNGCWNNKRETIEQLSGIEAHSLRYKKLLLVWILFLIKNTSELGNRDKNNRSPRWWSKVAGIKWANDCKIILFEKNCETTYDMDANKQKSINKREVDGIKILDREIIK